MNNLPESIARTPNIPWEHQTVEQLRSEMAYWQKMIETAPGFASAHAAESFYRGCAAWIKRRETEANT